MKPGTERGHEYAIVRSTDGIGDAWLEFGQFQKVPAVEREVFNLRAGDDTGHLMVVVADEREGGAHRHRFAHVTEFEHEAYRRGCAGLDISRTFQPLETRVLCGQLVWP